MGEMNYSLLTESDIREGVKKGHFQKEDIELVRDREGKIVKHLKRTCLEKTIIPPTLIQINSTYIYQADIKPVIEAIIEAKNTELFNDLEEKYQSVIDSLVYYKDHNDRLDELNSKALDTSSVFEKRVERFITNMNIDKLSEVEADKCIAMLDSYINILFIYIISTYWIHKDKVSKDTIANRKIEKLEKEVRYIYEQLLAKSFKDQKGANIITMDGSLYASYLLEEKGGIRKIEMLIKHDSRFSSLTDFMDIIQKNFIKKSNSYWDYQNQYQVPAEYKISMSVEEEFIVEKDNFASNLFNILEKISILKIIHTELKEAEKIDFDKIVKYKDEAANKALHLTTIPLALHSGR